MSKEKKDIENDYDAIKKEILRIIPNELIQLFFGNKLGKFDFSKSQLLSENVNSLGKRSGDRGFPDLIQTAEMLESGELIDFRGEVIFLWEPHSYQWNEKRKGKSFVIRMYDYKHDVYHFHGKAPDGTVRLIIPIVIFFNRAPRKNVETEYKIKGAEYFKFHLIDLRDCKWKKYIEEDNPAAAVLLGLMPSKDDEKEEVLKTAYRILIRSHIINDPKKAKTLFDIIDLLSPLPIQKQTQIYNEIAEEDKRMKEIKSRITFEEQKKFILRFLKRMDENLYLEFFDKISNEYNPDKIDTLETSLNEFNFNKKNQKDIAVIIDKILK